MQQQWKVECSSVTDSIDINMVEPFQNYMRGYDVNSDSEIDAMGALPAFTSKDGI